MTTTAMVTEARNVPTFRDGFVVKPLSRTAIEAKLAPLFGH